MPHGGVDDRVAAREVNSGAAKREAREKVLEAARRRQIVTYADSLLPLAIGSFT
jgi:hypothetical protein